MGGNLYINSSAKLDALKFNGEIEGDKAKSICKKALEDSFKKSRLIKIDGILSFFISSKKIKNVKIFKVRIVGKLETSFVVQKGDVFSHGKTIEEAKDSLKYKISDRDTSKFKKWKLTDVKSINELIQSYRAITGACEFGTKQFCESQKLKSKYSIAEVIKLTNGKFGNDKFKEFFK